ncbi:GNAT family N-acetyltransferase [Leptolyngbya sp. KIOST-1]|uniref:GNAT family N-acetyltransferase n=1 Tax=Leptolyngbya sp. KIOST-1 TaxID=1229172 RepID=UPI00055CED95|nr:GNAT family N-acetyltransferase [Leptolyngbya sp. KIOST-1]
MHLRLATATDIPAIATLYRETVLTHGPEYYTPAQTAAWATVDADSSSFRQFILDVTTYLVEDDTGLLGFAGLGRDGHVASAYVRHDRLHQGIGTKLMQTVLEQARRDRMPRLYAEASQFSLGLFIKFGFRQYDTEVTEHNGVQFTRHLVELIRAS